MFPVNARGEQWKTVPNLLMQQKKNSESPNCKFEALKTKPHVDIGDKMEKLKKKRERAHEWVSASEHGAVRLKLNKLFLLRNSNI